MATVTEIQDSKPPIEPFIGEKPGESTDRPIQKRGSLPPIKGGAFTIPPADAYEYTAKLTERDWAHVEGYVFRLRPRILRLPPLDKNIGFISGPIDEHWILENFGSGKYQLRLNDTDRSNKKGIFESFPDLDNPDYPPKYDIRELDIAHRENRQLVEHLKRIGKLTADGDIVQPGKSESNGEAQAIKEIALEAMRSGQNKPGLETKAFEKMMDMMSTASSKSIEIAMGQVKKEDPTAFLQLVMQMSQAQNQQMAPIMTMLTGLMTKMFERDSRPAGTDPMMTMMMEQLKNAREDAAAARTASEAALQRAHEKEMAMLENKAESVDPLAMVEKVLTLQDKLGGGGPKDWKAQLVDQGMAHLPEVLHLAERAIGYRATQTVNQQTAQQTQQPPRQQTQPQGEPVKTPPPPVSTDPDIVWLHQIFLAQGPMFVQAFRNDPENGAGLAIALEDMGLKPLYVRASAMGHEKILATIKLIPQMQADAMAIGTEAMLTEFVKDFCNPPDEDEEDDAEHPVIPEGRSATRNASVSEAPESKPPRAVHKQKKGAKTK